MNSQIDISGVDELIEKMDQLGDKSGTVIQEYLKEEGFDRIAGHIPGLIHPSGRNKSNWKKHVTSAASAAYASVFQGSVSGLELTVKSKTNYQYLYFPDDGSNTYHHAGNQQFMLRGAEEEKDTIVDEIIERLVAAFEE